jgi:DNA-directed RNA polymerase specialized sigma24 family protein
MTAALVLEPRERTRATRLVTVRQEPEVIVRAREGDETALAEIFDAVVTDVYGYAFSLTHRAREAERITDSVITRLPRNLQRQRWESVQSLKDQLMSVARAEVAGYLRRQSRTEVRKDLRAQTRHLVLAATAFATASYAVLLAI